MCTTKRALKVSTRAGIPLAVVVAVVCALPGWASAQEASLQGVVLSSSTGGPLEAVSVTLDVGGHSLYGVITDRNGFYQIGQIRPGTYVLRARLVGYREHQQQVTLAADERGRVNFRLEIEPVRLQGIRVETEKPAEGAPIRDLGRQVVTPAEIRVVPIPAGTGDLATYIQTLPGVTTTSDRGGQIFVRGGTPPRTWCWWTASRSTSRSTFWASSRCFPRTWSRARTSTRAVSARATAAAPRRCWTCACAMATPRDTRSWCRRVRSSPKGWPRDRSAAA